MQISVAIYLTARAYSIMNHLYEHMFLTFHVCIFTAVNYSSTEISSMHDFRDQLSIEE